MDNQLKNIYKNKITGKFYVLTKNISKIEGKFICIEDKYIYTIPFKDMKLWIDLND